MRRFWPVFTVAVVGFCIAAFGQQKTPGPERVRAILPAEKLNSLPSSADLQASLQRTLGYDPSLTWEIIDIRRSAIPGVTDALVSINRQPAQHIYVFAHQEYAFIGEMIPFGINPFAPARARLQTANGHSRGPQKPAILVVAFTDLQCVPCKAAQPVLEKLVSDFPRVRYIFQPFPAPESVLPWALKAAKYADCAGRMNKEHFWSYIDDIFKHQPEITPASAEDKLKELATAAGLDGAELAACAPTPEPAIRIQQSLDLGKALGVTTTPTVFINGRAVPNIQDIPYDQLKRLVQFEIAHAGK
jgi:protein-disulfide isomerase